MTMHFRALAEQAMADGAITPEEVLALRRDGWEDGRFDPAEAEALFVLNDHLDRSSPEWSDFFVEALCQFVLAASSPRGYLSEAQADWLIGRLDHDGKVESMAELELLARLFDRSESVPDRLKTYALAQIEAAVLTGSGPTRDGGSLDPGAVSETEVRLLRRFIFAAGGDSPASVSQGEAAMLFRIKDASLGKANASGWKQLFVQGVGNFLQGYSLHQPLPADRAAKLEAFMNDRKSGVGSFLGRMFDALGTGTANTEVVNFLHNGVGKSPGRDFAGEAGEAARVTDVEGAWLHAEIDEDGQTDEFEQALLDFLKQG